MGQSLVYIADSSRQQDGSNLSEKYKTDNPMCACVQTEGVDKKNPSRRYVAPEAGVIALMSGRNCMVARAAPAAARVVPAAVRVAGEVPAPNPDRVLSALSSPDRRRNTTSEGTASGRHSRLTGSIKPAAMTVAGCHYQALHKEDRKEILRQALPASE